MKKSISIIIIILTIFMFSAPSYANSKYNYYLALGDSIAEGYSLKNPEDRYISKLKKYLEIDDENFYEYTEVGLRAENLNEDIRSFEITEQIKKADLITISIGSNELLGVAKEIAIEILGITKEQMANLKLFNAVLKEKLTQNFGDNALKNAANGLNLLMKLYDELSSEHAKKDFEVKIEQYRINWGEAINYIKEINPNATIVVTEFYNPYYDVVVIKNFGLVTDKYIKELNRVLYELSENETKYKIAKIHDDFNVKDPRLTNVMMNYLDVYEVSIDPHPNVDGQNLIFSKVLEALDIESNILISNNNNKIMYVIYLISIIFLA